MRLLVVLLALTSVALPAAAQSASPDVPIEQYRAECRRTLLPARPAEVPDCVVGKIRERVRALAAVPAEAPLDVVEFTPWLVHPPLGPGTAKGVVYFVGGYQIGAYATGGILDRFHLTSYLFKTLADNGWDIVQAKDPERTSAPRGYQLINGMALTIGRRVAALRAQGYRRVIAAGHSLGGWATLAAAARGDLAADAILVSAPAAFGMATLDGTTPNPVFSFNASEFAALARAIRLPAVLLVFAGDVYEPGGRGIVAETAWSGHPHLVIDAPGGFSGHYAGWLPVFDYAYGDCIRGFLVRGAGGPCTPPPLSHRDFRSIASLRQIGDPGGRRITSVAPLAGRKFAAYTLQDVDNKELTYDGRGGRSVLTSLSETRESVAFRDGMHCAGQACALLVQWAPGQILEFDADSGDIHAWWIEER